MSCIPVAPQPPQAEPLPALQSSPVPRLLAPPCVQQAPPLRSFLGHQPLVAHGQTSLCSNPPPAPEANSQIPLPKPSAARLFQALQPTPLVNRFAAPPTLPYSPHQR